MYGTPTDPTPYIFAAYVIGALSVMGYAAWLFASRRRLDRYLAAFTEKGK
jgi:hypothetical protein